MDNTETIDLKNAPAVLELAEIQGSLGLPDGDFTRMVKFTYSGSSWGKIKCGTFSGNAAKALRAVKSALANHRVGGKVETLNGRVVFPHVREVLDAVTIARVATDEHKLVVVCGAWGSGKSVIADLIREEYPASHFLHAHPSWESSYLRSLVDLAITIGLTATFRSTGEAETQILAALKAAPGMLIIDEANHFSRPFLNFLKAVLNETSCAILLFTLPGHLGRMAATKAEESRQLLRRAVAIIHIPLLDSSTVSSIHAALYSEVILGNFAPSIVTAANSLDRLDTVIRIFEEANPDDPEDLPSAIERVKKAMKTVLKS
jgi:hypothetical protein